MANEFVARNGFISKDDSIVTGSVSATGGITGSILSASYAVTASYSPAAQSASYVGTATSSSYSSYAISSSITATASIYTQPAYAPTVGLNTYITPYLCWTETTGTIQSQPIGADNIVVTPVFINRSCSLASVGLSFASITNGVPTTASIGIYADNGSMLPITLIQSLGNVATTSSILQYVEVMPNPTQSLNTKTVYWLAFSADANLRVGIPTFNNMLLNPLLGVEITASFPVAATYISYKNISNYVTRSVGSSITLPSTLGQNTASYTICSYDSASSYIGPIINVTY